MYKYETNLHTFPVSRCAVAGVRETLEFYKEMRYDGLFITNHFLDGNVNIDRNIRIVRLTISTISGCFRDVFT